ncbi:MAG: nucleotidyltransferase family protein [Candidatus Bathyarchaeota archaeon]
MKASAIVLAAGKSSRMGSNKLLLPFFGKTVLETTLDALRGIETVVVTGHRPEEFEEVLSGYSVEVVHNPRHEEGMTTSFQAGLRSVDVDAVFLALGDQVGLDRRMLSAMVQVLVEDEDAVIVSPRYGDRRGHPVLFRRNLFYEILSLKPGETLKDVVTRYEDGHRYVEGDVWTVIDMDTPEEYEAAKKLWSLTGRG